ncbi:hypothetical protein AB0G95_21815 [Streptomyces virginiae]|uniref:hypothetical protein n=1 Tax=Streptomyces virginiae TaxID=1961 RepID=UPI0034283EB1
MTGPSALDIVGVTACPSCARDEDADDQADAAARYTALGLVRAYADADAVGPSPGDVLSGAVRSITDRHGVAGMVALMRAGYEIAAALIGDLADALDTTPTALLDAAELTGHPDAAALSGATGPAEQP